jgi:hypothetical protein
MAGSDETRPQGKKRWEDAGQSAGRPSGVESAESAAMPAVLAKRVISRPGARVTETVYDLSEEAARRLQTGGKIPPR